MADSGFHRDSIGLDVHVPHTFVYADAAARAAAVSADFTDPDDLFKLARQTSDQTYWVLEAITPSVVWNQLGGGGGAADLPFTSAADPTVDAAVTTAIIDLNSGTVITLTAAGNSQTLQAPTDTTAGRKFFVLNNDTSTNTITVNGTVVGAGQYVEFRWDGTAWLLTAGGAAAGPGGLDTQIQYNDNGVLAGDPNHLWGKTAKKETVLGDIEQVGGTAALLYTPTTVGTPVTIGAAPRNSVVQANYLYICDNNENSLRIYDITDPSVPALISNTATGPGRGIAVEGRYVYINNTDGDLDIIDVQDKSAPIVVGTLNHGNNGRGVKVSGKTCFITNNASVFGLQAIDVSDPANPVFLSSFNTALNARTEFDVVGTIAIVGTSGSTNHFQIVDVSDPSNMVSLANPDIGAGDVYWAVKIQGRYAYVVGNQGLLIFDISDPAATSATPVGSVDPGGVSSLRAIDVAGNFAYMVDAGENTVQCINISDPTTPVAISTALVIGQNPVSISVSGRFAFITDNTDDNFRIIDFTGIDAQNVNVGSVDAGQVNVRRDVKVGNNLSVATSATIGPGGINSDGEVIAAGRALGGASKNVVEIFQEADFPDVGGLIKPAPGVTYMVMQPITITKKIAHPTTVTGFDPAVIRTDAKYANIVTVNVASGSLLETSSGSGQLVLQNIRFESDGVVPFAIISGSSQTALLTELDDCDVVDFAAGSLFTTCIFNINNASFWTGSGTFKLVDCECNVIGAFNANFAAEADPILRVQSSAPGAPTKSFLTARNSKLSSQANEAFFMLHSNLVAGSTIRLTGVEASPFTPGTGAFFDTETGSVSALADSAGAPGVRTLVTSNGHTIADGDANVTMAGFTSATQMNATFVASNIVANQYEVVATFTTTDTGTWSNPSLTENSALVSSFDNPGQEESRAIGSMYVSNNVDVTVIATISTFTDLDLGTALAASNISAWTLTDAVTGELTYQGNEPFSGTIFASISAFGSGGTSEYRFRAVKNGTVLPDAVETVIDVGSAAATASLVVPVSVANSDTVRLQVENVDNTSNITVTHASVSVQ